MVDVFAIPAAMAKARGARLSSCLPAAEVVKVKLELLQNDEWMRCNSAPHDWMATWRRGAEDEI